MGLAASIDIELEKQIGESFFKSELFSNNWNYNDDNFISYIPLKEKNFEWVRVPISREKQVLDEIIKKLKLNENIGVILLFGRTHIGGQMLYFSESKMISFNININRKVLSNGKTDFEWYKNNFEKLFEKYQIKSIKHIEL